MLIILLTEHTTIHCQYSQYATLLLQDLMYMKKGWLLKQTAADKVNHILLYVYGHYLHNPLNSNRLIYGILFFH